MDRAVDKGTGERVGVVVVMPAYNAERTLKKTLENIPTGVVDDIILVDDGSRDATVALAQSLNLVVFCHNRNYGYGANQKTCYREALKTGNGIIVMLHPDYQYDPSLLPTLIEPIAAGRADVVLGSRTMGNNPMKQGMPWWKYLANRLLTHVENLIFSLKLSEYHTGYRAYSRKVLEEVNFQMNSDGFVFDQEIIAQIVVNGFRIEEVPVPARYFPEASSTNFWQSVVYGLSILRMLLRYWLKSHGILRHPQFDSLPRRYRVADKSNMSEE